MLLDDITTALDITKTVVSIEELTPILDPDEMPPPPTSLFASLQKTTKVPQCVFLSREGV